MAFSSTSTSSWSNRMNCRSSRSMSYASPPIRPPVPTASQGGRRSGRRGTQVMAGTVLRWGQSAYETEADLGLERAAATALGLGWARAPESAEPPDLSGVGALVVTSRVVVDHAALARFDGSLVLTTTSGWDHVDVAAA